MQSPPGDHPVTERADVCREAQGKLLPHHQLIVEASAISPDVVLARGYKSVTDPQELLKCGFTKAQCRVPSLLIPVWGTDGVIVNYQNRPDTPRAKPNGASVKYESPTGSRITLDVPPMVRCQIGDPNVPLWITEGARKADSAVSHGLCCIALLGVWGWRGKNAVGGKTALADWEDIALKQRKTFICFDSDVTTKKGVQQALERFVTFLESRGAIVKIVYLPATQHGEKVGLDDFFAAGGTTQQLEHFTTESSGATESNDKPKADASAIELHGLTRAITDSILAEDNFARDIGGRLYRYDAGVYIPDGEEYLNKRFKSLLNLWGKSKQWSLRKSNEAVGYVQVDAPMLWERPPLDRINLKNGIYDVGKQILESHTPEFLSPVQLPVGFAIKAICPAWENFVKTTFPEDAGMVAWEMAAWLMLPDMSQQKAVLMIGEGGNGKSTFLNALSAFIGIGNISSVSLQKMGSRFTTARLMGKLANICADLPTAHLADTDTFKKLTGGDMIEAEYKFGANFSFSPFARLIFSANKPPRSDDDSDGFFRRWLVIPFKRTFEASDTLPQHVLQAQLADPQELSGVLNKALKALPGIRCNGLTQSASMREAATEFRQETDPMAAWLEQEVVENPRAWATKRLLCQSYNKTAGENGYPNLAEAVFGRNLHRRRPKLQSAQRTIDGQRVWVWEGIGLRAADEFENCNSQQITPDAPDAQDEYSPPYNGIINQQSSPPSETDLHGNEEIPMPPVLLEHPEDVAAPDSHIHCEPYVRRLGVRE